MKFIFRLDVISLEFLKNIIIDEKIMNLPIDLEFK